MMCVSLNFALPSVAFLFHFPSTSLLFDATKLINEPFGSKMTLKPQILNVMYSPHFSAKLRPMGGGELLMVFGLTKWRMPSLGALNYAYFAAP